MNKDKKRELNKRKKLEKIRNKNKSVERKKKDLRLMEKILKKQERYQFREYIRILEKDNNMPENITHLDLDKLFEQSELTAQQKNNVVSNLDILKGMYYDYENELKARKELNEKLEHEGFSEFDEKLKFITDAKQNTVSLTEINAHGDDKISC